MSSALSEAWRLQALKSFSPFTLHLQAPQPPLAPACPPARLPASPPLSPVSCGKCVLLPFVIWMLPCRQVLITPPLWGSSQASLPEQPALSLLLPENFSLLQSSKCSTEVEVSCTQQKPTKVQSTPKTMECLDRPGDQ